MPSKLGRREFGVFVQKSALYEALFDFTGESQKEVANRRVPSYYKRHVIFKK